MSEIGLLKLKIKGTEYCKNEKLELVKIPNISTQSFKVIAFQLMEL